MLWTYKDNKIMLYEVKVNKEELKVIRDEIKEKYSDIKIDTQAKISFVRKIPVKHITRRNNNETSPKLAVILEDLILARESGLYELYQFKNKNLFSNEDRYGMEYMDEIMQNISFEKVYEEPFKNTYEMLINVIKNSDSTMNNIENIKKTMIPYQVVNELNKVKKLKKKK